MQFIYKKYNIFEVQQQIQNVKNKLNTYICCNTQRRKTFSNFESRNAKYLQNLLHNVNVRHSRQFGKSFARERGRERGIKENLFQQLIKIQRQWCYRAPIKKLSLHWQWASLLAITHYSSGSSLCLSPQPLILSSSGWSQYSSRHWNPNRKILLQFLQKVFTRNTKRWLYQESV